MLPRVLGAMVARACEPAQRRSTGRAQCFIRVESRGPGWSRARRSPGVEDDVELQRVYVIALDIFDAQLEVLVDDVSGSDAEQETVVVAEIVPDAAEQFD